MPRARRCVERKVEIRKLVRVIQALKKSSALNLGSSSRRRRREPV